MMRAAAEGDDRYAGVRVCRCRALIAIQAADEPLVPTG
jgi:hypothetical protein